MSENNDPYFDLPDAHEGEEDVPLEAYGHQHVYKEVEGQSVPECDCGAVYDYEKDVHELNPDLDDEQLECLYGRPEPEPWPSAEEVNHGAKN